MNISFFVTGLSEYYRPNRQGHKKIKVWSSDFCSTLILRSSLPISKDKTTAPTPTQLYKSSSRTIICNRCGCYCHYLLDISKLRSLRTEDNFNNTHKEWFKFIQMKPIEINSNRFQICLIGTASANFPNDYRKYIDIFSIPHQNPPLFYRQNRQKIRYKIQPTRKYDQQRNFTGDFIFWKIAKNCR